MQKKLQPTAKLAKWFINYKIKNNYLYDIMANLLLSKINNFSIQLFYLNHDKSQII